MCVWGGVYAAEEAVGALTHTNTHTHTHTEREIEYELVYVCTRGCVRGGVPYHDGRAVSKYTHPDPRRAQGARLQNTCIYVTQKKLN
jgi:hypothetical protein